MKLACWALAPLSNKFPCETGSFFHCGNPCHSPQSALILSSPFSQPHPHSLPPRWGSFQLALLAWSTTLPLVLSICLSAHPPPTSLVDYFFNSLRVSVPCSFVLWHLCLFIVFRLVIILLLVVRGSEGFLPMPQSWPELQRDTFSNNCCNFHALKTHFWICSNF